MFNISNPWSFGLKIKPHTTLINLHINHFIYNGSFGFFIECNIIPSKPHYFLILASIKLQVSKKIRISYETNVFQFLQRVNGGS